MLTIVNRRDCTLCVVFQTGEKGEKNYSISPNATSTPGELTTREYFFMVRKEVVCCKSVSPVCTFHSWITVQKYMCMSPGPGVITFFLLINVEMPTTVGISTFLSMKNSILRLSEPEKINFLIFFYTYENFLKISFSAELSMKEVL